MSAKPATDAQVEDLKARLSIDHPNYKLQSAPVFAALVARIEADAEIVAAASELRRAVELCVADGEAWREMGCG